MVPPRTAGGAECANVFFSELAAPRRHSLVSFFRAEGGGPERFLWPSLSWLRELVFPMSGGSGPSRREAPKKSRDLSLPISGEGSGDLVVYVVQNR